MENNEQLDNENIPTHNEVMADEATGGDQPVTPEPEAGQFRELRESLVRVGETIPNLIAISETKEGKPLVLTVPARDRVKPVQTTLPIKENIPDTSVAISDGNIRIFDIFSPPSWGELDMGVDGGGIQIADNPVSRYFRSGYEHGTMTEEDIIAKIGADGGSMRKQPSKDIATQLQILLQNLNERNEANMRLKPNPRFEADLRVAFDPKTFTPGENLAQRFNALVDKLQAK